LREANVTTAVVPATRLKIFLAGNIFINSLQADQEEIISTPVKPEKKRK
jgi:hypothetical protein